MANCDDEIHAAAGKTLSPRELASAKRRAAALAEKVAMSKNDPMAMEAVLGTFKDTAAARRLAAKRSAAMNYAALQRLKDWRQNVDFVKENPEHGLKALTTGSLKDFHGSSDNVLQRIQHDALARQGAYWTDLESKGLSEYARSGADDLNIGRAEWDLQHGKDEADLVKKYGKNAVATAKTFIEHKEAARVAQNQAGATIRSNPAHLASRVWDANKVAKAGGGKWGSDESFNTWKADLKDMDWSQFGDGEYENDPAAQKKVLESLYSQFTSGKHLQFSEKADPFKSREIVFKNADAEINILKKYGRGTSLAEQIDYGLQSSARDTQIMKKFGKTPIQNWDKFVNEWHKEINADESLTPGERGRRMKALEEEANRQKKYVWPSILDETGSTGDSTVAKLLAFTRGGMFISARIGASFFTNFGDVAFRMSQSKYWGTADNSLAEGVKSVQRVFDQMPAEDAKKVAAEWGIRYQTLTRPMGLTPEEEYGLGNVARFSQHVMKWGSHSFFANGIHVGSAVADGARFAFEKGKAFHELNEGMQASLRQFGMDSKEWDVLRKMDTEKYDGNDVFQPGNIRSMDIEKFRPLGEADASEDQLVRLRDNLADKFRNMLGEMAVQFSSDPSLSLRALTTFGTKRGTIPGEALRTFMGLKTWTLKYMRFGIGREIGGYDPREGFAKGLARSLGVGSGRGRGGLARLIAAGVVVGYARNAMYDVVSGKTPQNPATGEAFLRAFAFQSLGLLTDFVFDEERRNTTRPLGAAERITGLLGPGVSTMQDVIDQVITTSRQLREGTFNREKRGTAAQRLFSLLYHNIPGNNLYWAKYALDYMVLNNISNMLEPGYAKRLEARAKSRGQHYLFGAAPK